MGAPDTDVSIEFVAIGITGDTGQASVLDDSKARVARGAGSIGRVVGLAVGIDGLADLLCIQVIPGGALSTDVVLEGFAPDVPNDDGLAVGSG